MSPAVHVAVALGIVIAFSELAIGIGTLLGLYSRLAATGGMLLSLMFFLTVSYNTTPYYYGSDIVFAFAWTTLALYGAGTLSLDGYFARERDAALAREKALAAAGTSGRRGGVAGAGVGVGVGVDRRIAIAKLGAASVLGGFVLFCGGVAAAGGRVFGRKTNVLTGPTFPTSSRPATTTGTGAGTTSGAGTTTGTGTGTTSTTAPGPRPGGKLLGAATAVEVGSAVGFTDPYQGIPAYVVQPQTGDFRAFSAICTHAGCTVSFVQSVEQFQCPCHGSIYSAVTGDVIQGPAPSPLPSIGVEVSGGDLYVID
jgi:thiosulfate dehydrogenase [quinone] large subunit